MTAGARNQQRKQRVVDKLRGGVAATIALATLLTAAPGTARAGETPTPISIIPLGMLNLGEAVSVDGLVGDGAFPDRDVDLYSLEFDESLLPLRLTADVDADDGADLLLRVFNGAGQELFNNDDAGFDEADPALVMTLVEAGPILVGVSGAANPLYDFLDASRGRSGPGGAYSLTLRLDAEDPPSGEHEPNDSVLSATWAGSASFSVTGGFIGDGPFGRRDVDVYFLSLPGPVQIDVEVRTESIGSVLRPVVRLRTCRVALPEPSFEDECRLAFADAGATGENDLAISALLGKPSDVFVFIAGNGNARFDPAADNSGEPGSTGPYDLAVTVTPIDDGGPLEPNDSILTAMPLPGLFVEGRPETIEVDAVLGDGLYAASRGDRDFYEVRVADEGRILQVEVAPTDAGGSLDPIVAAYDLDGNLLARNDNAADSRNARLLVSAACGHIDTETLARSLHLMVGATKQKPPLNPFVPPSNALEHVDQTRELVTGATGPYRLSVTALPSAVACVIEPNDTLDTASDTGLVGFGSFACSEGAIGDHDFCDPISDVDIWSLEVTQVPAVVEATASSCGDNALFHIGLRLFDAAGNEIAQGRGVPELHRDNAFFTDKASSILSALVEHTGRYFVAVIDGRIGSAPFDPNVMCSAVTIASGPCTVGIVVRGGLPDARPAAATVAAGGDANPGALLATRRNGQSNRIDALDPDTGEVLGSIPTPQSHYGGAEGLARRAGEILYMGTGRYPLLYRLDPQSGNVSDAFHLWMGSGVYTDLAVLGDDLYVLDVNQQSLHVLDLAAGADRFVKTLPLGVTQGITIGGGLAALAGPRRLFVGDAFGTGAIYEIDPVREALAGAILEPNARPIALGGLAASRLYVADWEPREISVLDRGGTTINVLVPQLDVGSFASVAALDPMFPDFDADGDVDLVDVARWQVCFTGASLEVSAACTAADSTANGHVDLEDAAILAESVSGP